MQTLPGFLCVSYAGAGGAATFGRMFTPEQAIDHWLRVFAKEFVANRAADIVKADLRNTDRLLASLYAKVHSQPDRGIFLMTFFAAGYGRFQDMRRRYSSPGGTEMEQALEAWAEKEGVGKFIKGRYRGVYQGKAPERVLNRIAWGIMRKYRNKGTARKRGWYNKGKTRDIESFYALLLKAYREAVMEQLKQKI